MAKKNRKHKKLLSAADHGKMREAYKLKLWTYRIVLVKQGNLLTRHHLFGEAAVSYEKYLRILELIYDCKPSGLSPGLLKDTARTTELSIVAGIYWDLVRIYDTNSAYLERQKIAAEQLAKFINFTPLHSDLIKKANIFQKTCQQPAVIRKLISASKKPKARCFIATAVFDSPDAKEVQFLRLYRDETLKLRPWGRKFIIFYYKYSPKLACFIDRHDFLKVPVRLILRFVIKCVT